MNNDIAEIVHAYIIIAEYVSSIEIRICQINNLQM